MRIAASVACHDGNTAQAAELFGWLAGGDQPYAVTNPAGMFTFAFNVLPMILVISRTA